LPVNVFLSVGRTGTTEQSEFVAAVGSYMQTQGLALRTVGRNDFSRQKPLQRIAEVMRSCSGTIVIALERLYIIEGEELRGGVNADHLADVKLPTVWNQIEAAMAYILGHPLLAIVESGLRNEGLLEEGYDWYVSWLSLKPSSLLEPEFKKTFADWKRNVEKYQAGREAR
jgi:hypothetical protein